MQTISKGLGWIVKVAGMVICAPVTWLVAGQLFADVGAAGLRFLVQLSAVALVEGVFLSNWLLLEFDKNAAPEIKVRYALTALGLYFGLWALAWQHGEGLAGIVFRGALGAALAGSGWDTYVTTWQRLTARADRDVTAAGAVKRHRRQRAIADAKQAVDAEYDLSRARREVDTLVSLEALAHEKQHRLAAVRLDHKARMAKLSHLEGAQGAFPYPIDKARQRHVTKARDSRETRMARLVDTLRDDPSASLRQLGDAVGAAPETVRRDLAALESAGAIRRNGHGVEVLAGRDG